MDVFHFLRLLTRKTNEREDLFTSMTKICHKKERIVQIEPNLNWTGNRFQGSTEQLFGELYITFFCRKKYKAPAIYPRGFEVMTSVYIDN